MALLDGRPICWLSSHFVCGSIGLSVSTGRSNVYVQVQESKQKMLVLNLVQNYWDLSRKLFMHLLEKHLENKGSKH